MRPVVAARLRAIALMVPAMVLWVLMESLFRFDRHSTFQVVWTRYGVYLGLLLLLVLPRRGLRALATRRPALHALRASTMLAMPAAFIFGRAAVGPQELMAVFWVAPLLVPPLARVLLGERLGIAPWCALALAWLATLRLFGVSQLPSVPGLAWGLTMAASFALFLTWTRVLARTESVATNLFYTGAGVFGGLTLTAPLWFVPWTAGELAGMALIGVLILGALAAIEAALHRAEVSVLAPVLFVQPLLFFLLATWRGRDGGAATGLGATVAALALPLAIAAASALALRRAPVERSS